jgi:hypothetical protein
MTEGKPGGADPAAIAALDGQATTALILGILGVTLTCGICGPFALFKGKDVNKKLQEMGAAANGKATAGFILGIIGTIELVFAVLWILFAVVIGIGFAASGAAGG